MAAAKSPWRSWKSAPKTGKKFDAWMHWDAAPSTMGWGDSFRVVDVWYEGGKWVHESGGKIRELNADYLVRWMPAPKEPNL